MEDLIRDVLRELVIREIFVPEALERIMKIISKENKKE